MICIPKLTNRDQWAIDPAKTLVMVPDFPRRQASTALMLWLGRRFEHIQCLNKPDVAAMRNTLVRDLVKRSPRHFEHFVMFDNDMHPTETSDVFWEPTADVVCVQCEHGHGGVWARPDDFHCNGFRFNRRVAEQIALPWFLKSYSADGCDLTGCSCQFFRAKVLAEGFTIQRAGWMVHAAQDGG